MKKLPKRKSTRSDDSAPTWSTDLGAAVRARRKSLHLTQEELATLAGCGPVFVYALERGKASLRLDKLVDVLRVLGLEILLRPGKAGLASETPLP